MPSVTLRRAPLSPTPRNLAHHAHGRPCPGPLRLVSSPWQPGPHRSTGTRLGKARPPFSGCRQPQGHGQGLQGRRGAPKVQRALPRLGPRLARCSPKEAGEEGLRVLHLALRFSQQRHSLSLLPGGVHDVAQLLGSGPTQPGDDSQAQDTAHSAELHPLRSRHPGLLPHVNRESQPAGSSCEALSSRHAPSGYRTPNLDPQHVSTRPRCDAACLLDLHSTLPRDTK